MDCNTLRIRGFVIDQDTRKPIPQVLLELQIETEQQDEPNAPLVRPRVLATNAKGYFSFAIQKEIAAVATRFNLLMVDNPDFGLINLKTEDLIGTVFQRLEIPRTAVTLPADAIIGLPAIEFPDRLDYQVAGSELAHNAVGAMGADLCAKLLPNVNLKTNFKFEQLVFGGKNETETITLTNNKNPYCKEKVKYDLIDCQLQKELSVREGELLSYQIIWCLLGHSLGEIINSFSLAPCETIKVSTLDWSRQESLNRQESSNYSEQLLHDLRNDRSVEQVMSAFQSDFSVSSQVMFKIPVINVGGQVSGQYSRQQKAVNSIQNIVDTVRQASSAVRRQTATLVVATNQQESAIAQSRGIKNHNKCHTLNLVYHSLVKHYEIVTKYLGSQDVLLIKYCVERLTAEKIIANAHIFRNNLLDTTLVSCFNDFIESYLCCDDATDPRADGSNNNDKKENTTKQIFVRLRIGKDKPGSGGKVKVNIKLKNGSIISRDFPHNGKWDKNTTYTANISLPKTISPADIVQVGLSFGSSGINNDFKVDELVIQYRSTLDNQLYRLYSNTNLNDLRVRENTPWWTGANVQLPPVLPDPPAPNDEPLNTPTTDCQQKKCCEKIVLNHFKEHEVYYNSLLWLNENPVTRAIRLDSYEYQGKPLSYHVINEPIGVIGNWVAFVKADAALVNNGNVSDNCEVVTLPTRGYYLEALLGQCGACEMVTPDSNEYRDWECTDLSPELTDLSTGRNNANLINVTPSSFPSNSIVSIKTDSQTGSTKGIFDVFDKIFGSSSETNLDKDAIKALGNFIDEQNAEEKIALLKKYETDGLISEEEYKSKIKELLAVEASPTLEDELKKIDDLKSRQVITQAEYDQMRQKLIERFSEDTE